MVTKIILYHNIYKMDPPEEPSEMTVEQLRTLSDKLYLTMNTTELENRYNKFLMNKTYFPKEINDPDTTLSGRVFYSFWIRGGPKNTPTNLFYGDDGELFRFNMREKYEPWRKNNERMYFEGIYRALSTPMNVGGKRTRRTPRRKSKKSRKNKRKTKRRRT